MSKRRRFCDSDISSQAASTVSRPADCADSATTSTALIKRRASPSAQAANCSRASDSTRMDSPSSSPSFSACTARSTSCCNSSGDSDCSTYTRARDNSAELTSKDGFSVVAPMKVNSPLST
ncbi:hypothetical protein D3C86_1582380 [compost metagenome]